MTQDTLAKQLGYILLQLWEAGEKIEKLQEEVVKKDLTLPSTEEVS